MPVDYALWQYLHILLFVYWLGADLGVFLAARYVARGDLPLAERLRFLDLLLKIDMGPRTALILVVPVGTTLAAKLGVADFVSGWLPFVWLLSLGWLALAWHIALRPRHPAAAVFTSIDRGVRIAVVAGFTLLASVSLLTGAPILAPWLAVKLLLFAGVVTLGLLLRGVLRDWAAGFDALRRAADGDAATVAAANARISAAQRRSTPYAVLLWLLVAVIAFLGVAKPLLDGA
jgi:hypothetical protein